MQGAARPIIAAVCVAWLALIRSAQADVVSRDAADVSLNATSMTNNPSVLMVIDMLTSLQKEIVSEGADAEKVFGETKKLCSARSRTLRQSYDAAKSSKEKAEADILQLSNVIDTENGKIEDLTMSIAADEQDLKEAEDMRTEEKTVFVKEEKALKTTVDALDRALAIIGHEARKTYKSEALLQMEQGSGVIAEALSAVVKASGIGSASHEKLVALIQSAESASSQSEDAEDAEIDRALGVQPVVKAYESRSGGILEVLNEVLEDAQTELADLRKAEQDKQNAFEKLKQSLEDKIKFKTRDLDLAKETKNEASTNKAKAEEERQTYSKEMEQDKESLTELQTDCISKARTFEEDTQARNDEVEAMASAKEMIGQKLQGSVSFLQVARTSNEVAAARFEDNIAAASAAARSVRRLAVKMESPSLIELAGRLDYVAADRSQGARAGDPFKKVRGLIEGMIDHLQAEARAEAEHQTFCQREMGVTGTKIEDRQEDVGKLTAKLDKAKSDMARMASEVAQLRKELVELAETQLEMDRVRKEEKALYDKEFKDNNDGMEAVKMAMQELRTFYAKMGDASGRGKRVVSMLEYTTSDMHKRITMLKAKEKESVDAYKKITDDNEIVRATKQQTVDHLTKEITDLQKAIGELSADHAATKEELDALNDYMEKLKDQCIAKPEPYEVRRDRRNNEIKGLKNALAALDGSSLVQVEESRSINAVFLQLRGSHGHRRVNA